MTMRDLITILPMSDAVMLLGLKGHLVLEALENGVSRYPEEEGRFPCISGIRFAFKAKNAPGSRIVRDSVIINGQPLDLEREYTCATTHFLSKGKDGYEALSKGRTIVSRVEASILPNILQQALLKHTKAPRQRKESGKLENRLESRSSSVFLPATAWVPIAVELDGRIQKVD